MKRLAPVLIALALLLPVFPAPAGAGDFTWTQSWCRPDVWWYHQPGQYVQYWRDDHAWPSGIFAVHANWPTSFGARRHLQVYADNGYECGRMGAPLGDMTSVGSGRWRQSMEHGALWYLDLNASWIWCPFGDQWCYYT